MARGATIYRAQLELSLVDRDVYAELPLTLARHPSETLERTLMRLLAFGLRYEPGLEFGRGVSATDEPDAWSREGDGRVRQWVEVGQPDGKRLVKAARQSERVSLFAFGPGLAPWRAAQIDAIDPPANLGVAQIDDEFVAEVAAEVERQLRWSLTVSEGIVFLSTDDGSFETTPEIWLGDPLG